MKLRVNEIGSEFWIDDKGYQSCTGDIHVKFAPLGFSGDCLFLLSGRTAIDAICQDILKNNMTRTVYLPAYCCDSMVYPFINRGFNIQFYDVSVDGQGIKCHLNMFLRDAVVYINNYFGYSFGCNVNEIVALKKRGVVIVYDKTHGLFDSDDNLSEIADYVLCSLRKWMSISTGAIACKNTGEFCHLPLRECKYAEIKNWGMRLKYQFLCGDDNIKKEDFFKYFNLFNKSLHQNYSNYCMDRMSIASVITLDFGHLAETRKNNASFLYDNLSKVKNLSFVFRNNKDVVPLFVPVLINDNQRNSLKDYLVKHYVYCPSHWPKSFKISGMLQADELYDNEISLVCDQRYSNEDMQQIILPIKKYFNTK